MQIPLISHVHLASKRVALRFVEDDFNHLTVHKMRQKRKGEEGWSRGRGLGEETRAVDYFEFQNCQEESCDSFKSSLKYKWLI